MLLGTAYFIEQLVVILSHWLETLVKTPGPDLVLWTTRLGKHVLRPEAARVGVSVQWSTSELCDMFEFVCV